jgi:phosphoglycerate dehydrogenase-like enzyme
MMDPIYVLSTMSFPEELLDSLRAVSPRLTVVQQNATSVDEVPSELWGQVEVLYTLSAVPDPGRAPRLRWVQLHSAGVNQVQNTPLWDSDVVITTLSGIHASNMAEYVLMMMLALAHRLPRMLAYQARAEWPSQRWAKFVPQELRAVTVGVIGYGSIGQEVGRLAHALGMRVLGLHRGGSAGPPGYELPELVGQPGTEPDRLYTPDQLTQMLAECDYVVLAVPHTSATHHLIDQMALRAMKPTAVLVNVARGAVVDEAAVIHALREGWIAGAALDVFEQEPLPADSPLWKMENVVISPHVAGFTPHYDERATALFAENLRRYLAGEPLLNQVERGREY